MKYTICSKEKKCQLVSSVYTPNTGLGAEYNVSYCLKYRNVLSIINSIDRRYIFSL